MAKLEAFFVRKWIENDFSKKTSINFFTKCFYNNPAIFNPSATTIASRKKNQPTENIFTSSHHKLFRRCLVISHWNVYRWTWDGFKIYSGGDIGYLLPFFVVFFSLISFSFFIAVTVLFEAVMANISVRKVVRIPASPVLVVL